MGTIIELLYFGYTVYDRNGVFSFDIYKYKELLEGYSFLSENGITNMVDTTESMYKFNKLKTHVIKGEKNNLKITYKSDLNTLESITRA